MQFDRSKAIVQVPLELVDAITNYFGGKPYGEVAGLMAALHNTVGPQVHQQMKDAEAGGTPTGGKVEE